MYIGKNIFQQYKRANLFVAYHGIFKHPLTVPKYHDELENYIMKYGYGTKSLEASKFNNYNLHIFIL